MKNRIFLFNRCTAQETDKTIYIYIYNNRIKYNLFYLSKARDENNNKMQNYARNIVEYSCETCFNTHF